MQHSLKSLTIFFQAFLIPWLGAFFFSIPTMAQNEDLKPLSPRIETFDKEENRGGHQIFSADRDPQGGLWFGSNNRLLHYTGERWKAYPIGTGSLVFDIDIDDQGRIWIAGRNLFGYMEIVPSSHQLNKGDTAQGDSAFKGSPGDLRFVPLNRELPDSLQEQKDIRQVIKLGDRVFFKSKNALIVHGPDTTSLYRPGSYTFGQMWKVKDEIWIQDFGVGLLRLKRNGSPIHSSRNPKEKLVPGSKRFGKGVLRDVLGKAPGVIKGNEVLIVDGRNGAFRFDPSKKLPEDSSRLEPLGKEGNSFLKTPKLNGCLSLGQPSSDGPSKTRIKNPWDAPLLFWSLTHGNILSDRKGVPLKVQGAKDGMRSLLVWESTRGKKGSGNIWSATNKGIARSEIGDPRTYAWEGKAFSGGVNGITRFEEELLLATDQGIFMRSSHSAKGLQEEEKWDKLKGLSERVLNMIQWEENGEERLLLSGLDGTYELKRPDGAWRFKKRTDHDAYCFDTFDLGDKGTLLLMGDSDKLLIYESSFQQEHLLVVDELPIDPISVRSERTGKNGSELRIWMGGREKGMLIMDLSLSSLTERIGKNGPDPLGFHWEELLKGQEGIRGIRSQAPQLGKGEISFFNPDGEIIAAGTNGLFKPVNDPFRASNDTGTDLFRPDSSLGCNFTICEGQENGYNVFHLQKGGSGAYWIKGEGRTLRLVPKKKGYRIDSLPFRGIGLGSVKSFFTDTNGVTWIGGMNGLMRYDPRVEKDFKRDFSARIDRIEISRGSKGGQERKEEDSVLFDGLWREPAREDPLLHWKRSYGQPKGSMKEIPFGSNEITFYFTAPYYERQGAMHYSYRLRSFDEGWSPWKKEVRKAYTSLDPGTYTFEVKARNAYGVKSRTSKYRFRILPPWYRTWTAYGGYGIAGVGLIWLLIWLNSRRLVAQKQRLEKIVDERTKEIREQKEEMEKQKEMVEEAHEEITQSINYAQKIQYALLQSEEHVSSHLPEHFILFKPYSQVSGDFYWAKEHKGHFYIAAVDCTGHGVPGAFMSMLGISQLNEIMNTEEELTPGEILTDLRERVVRELSGNDPESAAKDGMDAAVLRIANSNSKDEEMEVQFAGAQNPLYVIRKGIAEETDPIDGEVHVGSTHVSPLQDDQLKPFKKSPDGIEIKGDGQPVGYDEYAKDAFTTIELKLQKGDMLYIFSDGYADQFGGPKGKKFRYGPFKQLLAGLHEKPLQEQKQELDRTFEDWKNEAGQEQIDDVVVIGVRL